MNEIFKYMQDELALIQFTQICALRGIEVKIDDRILSKREVPIGMSLTKIPKPVEPVAEVPVAPEVPAVPVVEPVPHS